MGQKGHIMVQKGLKVHKKRQKIEFLDLKRRFFSLAELGGTPPTMGENHSFWLLKRFLIFQGISGDLDANLLKHITQKIQLQVKRYFKFIL